MPAVPWGPVAAVVVTISVYFGGQFLGGVLVYAAIALFGWDSQRITAWFSNGTFGQFLLIAAVEVITFFLLYSFIRHKKANLGSIGINRPKLRHLGYALLGFGIYFPIFFVTLTALRLLIPTLDINQQQQIGFESATTRPELLLVFISLVLLPPLIEEMLCRGFLFSGLKTKLPIIGAALVTSLVFAMPHLQIGSGNPLLWAAFIDTFILSMVLVYLRVSSGSLWPSIGLHAVKNGIAFVALFVVKLS